MATTITNQASLNYTSGNNTLTANSNTATVTLQGLLDVTKHSLETGYEIGGEITYNVFIENTSAGTISNIVVVDDLGTYATTTPTNVTPLTYMNNAKIFINNVFSNTATGTVAADEHSVSFNVGNLTAGSTLLLQYKAQANEYAGGTLGTSKIDNIVSVTATGIPTPITATNSIPLASYARLTIEKAMAPNPIQNGNVLTYSFDIKNYGSTAATGVSFKDTLAQAPTIVSVTVDDDTNVTDYDYTAGVFTYPSTGTYSVDAATFTQDLATGITTIEPGTSKIIIYATI